MRSGRSDKLSPSLRFLEPVIANWRAIIRDYSANVKNEEHGGPDAAYWHLERSNVGILAAAAWMAGVPALEEFTDDKVDRGTGMKSKGRADLWLQRPPHNNENRDLLIEAKKDVFRSNWDSESKLDTLLGDACKDVEKLSYEHRLGIAFVVPEFEKEDLDSSISEFLRLAQSNPDAPDIRAWAPCGDNLAETPRWPTPGGKLLYYPGVLMLGRLV